MKNILLTAIVALASVSLTTSLIGCGAATGSTVVKYDRGGAPIATEAPRDGSYQLYYFFGGNPVVTVPLKKGEKLGFEASGDKVMAVAGDKSYPVEVTATSRTAYWKHAK